MARYRRQRVYRWSFWVVTEIEHALLTVTMHTRLLPGERRERQRAARNVQALQKPFSVLDRALADGRYLVENRFTVADLNVAAVLAWLECH